MLRQSDFQNLLQFRTSLRRFLHWSESQAREVGLTPGQHQLLVAVKGHPGPHSPTVSDLAGYLLLKPHSTVGLIDRAEAAGLVERHADPHDRRLTRIRLSAGGEAALTSLTPTHFGELRALDRVLHQLASERDGEATR